jgi:ribosome modulation factor
MQDVTSIAEISQQGAQRKSRNNCPMMQCDMKASANAELEGWRLNDQMVK